MPRESAKALVEEERSNHQSRMAENEEIRKMTWLANKDAADEQRERNDQVGRDAGEGGREAGEWEA